MLLVLIELLHGQVPNILNLSPLKISINIQLDVIRIETQRKCFNKTRPIYPLASPIRHVTLHEIYRCKLHVKTTRKILHRSPLLIEGTDLTL